MTRRHTVLSSAFLLFATATSLPAGPAPVTLDAMPPGWSWGEIAGDAPATQSLHNDAVTAVFPNHPGWPVSFVGGASPPVCADLDPSYPGLETAFGTLSSGVNFYVFHADGTLMTGYPIDLGIFVAASPSVADIDGDGALEIIVGDFGGNRVWAMHANGTPLPGWPIAVGANVRSTAALADLDPGFTGLEVIVGVQDGSVHAWHHDATPVPGWPVTAGNFVERCSPAVGDVDGDGDLEVFVGSFYNGNVGSTGGIYGFDHTGMPLPGWPKLAANHVSIISSPALADLDSDGDKEIIVGTYEANGRIFAWHHNGTDVAGWPFTIPRGLSSSSSVTSSPAVGDVDGDGRPDVVCGSTGQCGSVYVWSGNGTVQPGWPFLANTVIDGSSPSIGDVDGDGRLEIVVGSGSGFTPFGCSVSEISKAYVLRRDGTVLPGWPVDLGTPAPPYPALADMDLDGQVEVVLSFAENVYVWDAPGSWNAEFQPWPYFHLGIDHTGNFGAKPPVDVSEDTPKTTPSGLRVWPNPLIDDGPVFLVGAADQGAFTIDVLDASGRIVRTLSGTDASSVNIRWDGRDAAGRSVTAGIYFLYGRASASRVTGRLAVLR